MNEFRLKQRAAVPSYRRHLSLVTLSLLAARVCLAQSTYVPLNHWAYDFVERFETKGVIHGVLNGTKPYSREEMTKYLVEIEKQAAAGSHLNSVEKRQLDFLKLEFREDYEALGGHNDADHHAFPIERLKRTRAGRALPNFFYGNNRNLLELGDGIFKAYIDPVFYQQWLYANPDSLANTERVYEQAHGFTLYGKLGGNIGFFFDFRDTKQWGTRTYPDQFDITAPGLGFVNGYGTHIWHDETNAYFIFKLPYVQLMLGKDWNYWGPGHTGALGLSNNATSFDQVKLQSRFWRLKFTWLLGFLRTFPRLVKTDGTTNPKSLVAHRLEIDVARWLDVGLYEMVVFGNRRFELAYANPVNFYRSAEHFLGDDDNATIGADFELLLIPHVKLYGELFIDDLSTSKGSNFQGNKVGFLAGGYWVDALNISNLDVRLEYVRTRPYLYTHRNEINKFTNFSTGLGHRIGPNADLLSARLQYRFSKSLLFAATAEAYRHGANDGIDNTGGDIDRPFEDHGVVTASFLGGVREKRRSLALEVSYELVRNLYVTLNLNRAVSDNIVAGNLPARDVNRSEFFVNVALNR